MKYNLKLSLLLMALIIAAAGFAISNPQRINQSLPPALDRLLEAKLIEIKDEAGQVVLSGTFATTSDLEDEIERNATLTGDGSAKGKAEIELVKDGETFSEQELEVVVEGMPKAAKFKLFIDDTEVIAFSTNKSGKASMKLSHKNAKKN